MRLIALLRYREAPALAFDIERIAALSEECALIIEESHMPSSQRVCPIAIELLRKRSNAGDLSIFCEQVLISELRWFDAIDSCHLKSFLIFLIIKFIYLLQYFSDLIE